MRKFLFLLVLLLAVFTQISAQKTNCGNSQPRPIDGPQRPCAGDIVEYCIEKEKVQGKSFTVEEWEVPRAFAGEGPVGWEIVDKDNIDLPGDPQGYESADGEYLCITVRVGQKPGTMKVTVTHPDCGTKVATLPVMPGISFWVDIDGPLTPCIGEEYTYTATININQKGNKPSNFEYAWHYPADWQANGPTNQSTINLVPGTTFGEVWAEVIDINNKTNNGNGLGPKGYCESGSNKIMAYPQDCEEEPCVIETDFVTFSYLGAMDNNDGTSTIAFSIENNFASSMDMVWIETSYETEPPTPLTTNPPDGFDAFVDEETGLIMYFSTEAPTVGGETVIFSFTLPTIHHELFPFYTLSVFAGENFAGTGFNTNTCDDTPIEFLAVELSSFHGKATPSGIELTWTTASEENNDRFEVQNSSDGHEFRTIGTVKGTGNSSTSLNYSFLDKTAARGTNYYRLSQIDKDGTLSLSKVIALDNTASTESAGITIYPNPATGENLNIVLSGAKAGEQTYLVRISDINGRKVFEQEIKVSDNNELSLPLSKLKISNGLYLLNVQGVNLIATQKFLINQ